MWNGGTGAIDSEEYKIKYQDEWPFKDATQIGTFPEGGVGAITNTDYQFTDNSFANPDELYNPFDFDNGDC